MTVEVGMPFWVDILGMSSDSLGRWHFNGDGDNNVDNGGKGTVSMRLALDLRHL